MSRSCARASPTCGARLVAMTAPHFRNRRPSPEVRRVLDFVNRPLVHALGVFKDSDERCQRDVILIMAEPDETARWVHEQLRTFSPPHARPPVLEKNSVQVMAVPIK